MNEPLRRALLRARLREDDVAACLGVDPKTVRRWLNGRRPLPAAPAGSSPSSFAASEADLWRDAAGSLTARDWPEELGAIYPHRSAVPREVWARLSPGRAVIGVLTTAPCSSLPTPASCVSSPTRVVRA